MERMSNSMDLDGWPRLSAPLAAGVDGPTQQLFLECRRKLGPLEGTGRHSLPLRILSGLRICRMSRLRGRARRGAQGRRHPLLLSAIAVPYGCEAGLGDGCSLLGIVLAAHAVEGSM